MSGAGVHMWLRAMLIHPGFLIAVLLSGLLSTSWYWLHQRSGSNSFQWIGESVDRVSTRQPLVALTFDDGPRGPVSRRLLQELNRLNTKATFFLVGRQIKQHPQFTAELWRSGHQLGNHSFAHKAMDDGNLWRFWQEVRDTDRLIRQSGYQGPIHFRAPMGKKRLALPLVLALAQKKHVLWDVNSQDYKNIAPELMIQTVLQKVRPGSIVLLHDRPNTVAALAGMVAGLRAKGYQLVTVDQLLAQQR